MSELKPSQQRAMGEILHHINNGEKRIVIKGSAGTGKTYMTNALIKRLKQPDMYTYGGIWVTAPTHKALSVLHDKIDHEGKNYIHFYTIHSGLQLKMVIDRYSGKQTFSREKFDPKWPPFKGAVVVLVDEASMLSSLLLFGKDGIHEHPNLIFIFIGDPKQLPPVGEKESPVFTQGWPTVELTEIIRQGEGSPIIELSNNLELLRSRDNWINSKGEGYFFEDSERFLIDKLAEVNGTDEMKYLAYTNKQCNHINHHVRHTIYDNPAKIEKGESLIFSEPYIVNENLSYKNNQEITVDKIELREMNLLLPTVESKIIYKDGKPLREDESKYQKLPIHMYIINEHIKIIHENYDKYFSDLTQWIVGECHKRLISWPLKYQFEQQVAATTYNHAITVHKSQGSTYGLSIVDVGNINSNRNGVDEKVKMLYTGVTRASHKVALFNTEKINLKI